MSKNKKNTFVELEIESIGFEGIAIARNEGMVYFVKGGVPGDRVIAKELRKRKKYREAQVEEIIAPSPDRIDAPCRYFGPCGGCTWQNLKYSKQLEWKRRHVEDAFTRIGKIEDVEYLETLPSPKQYEYRNKMEFSFGSSRWMTAGEIESGEDIRQKHFALGLHIPGRFDKILDIDECLIHKNYGNKILNTLREKALELGVSAYNSRAHIGFLRNIIIRTSDANDEIMAALITNAVAEAEDRVFIDWYENEFPAALPEIDTVLHAVNDTRSPVASQEMRIINGSGAITEQILGLDYRISPYSFFQTNSSQLDGFISLILDYAELTNESAVWDLYCGTGSITLPASRKCKYIYGIELSESSVADARANMQLNNIDNAEFYQADLHAKDTPALLDSLPRPDVIIIDPPRAGMHKNLVDHILAAGAGLIVYVSCNPATQARDCALLADNYTVEKIRPVDMFPQTFHVESVALLRRKA
ncbi:MAG: 23S rRNA (uracil(1939)-C(5))-methyltransferase RlmD [Candidatus Kapaibacterium sp.]